MKKLLTMLLALAMIISLFAGCGKKEPSGTDPAAETGKEPAPVAADDNDYSKKAALIIQVGGLGDEGWNDDCYAGMQKAKEELGVDFTCVEPTEAADTEAYLRQLGEAGYGLVICMEYGALSFVYDVAPLYPDTTYVAIGATGPKDIENLIGTMGEVWNSSYLGGALAAFAATDGNEIIDGVADKPGCKIGVVFGLESAGFYNYEDAFKQGAVSVNPDCDIIVDYNGGFSDTEHVKSITENMINNLGCDIVWLCCGTAGLGGLQACRLNNALAIGVDANQDHLEAGSVLTSIRLANDMACYNFVKNWKEGSLESLLDENNDYYMSFAKGEVGVTDMATIREYVTNQENFEKLLELKDKVTDEIVNGDVEVWAYERKQERFPYKK